MMKVWEIERKHMDESAPIAMEDDNAKIWEEQSEGPEKAQDALVSNYWASKVPGSRAQECMMAAAIQATENRGYVVADAEHLVLDGLRAVADGNVVGTHEGVYKVLEACRNATKDPSAPYWKSRLYDDFASYAEAVSFPAAVKTDMGKSLVDRIEAGWLAQIIGGAYGTCMEGYATDNILRTYPRLDIYQRKPNTYNDDITYELALLLAYEKNGKATTGHDIAMEWITRISFGWSAEDMALRNLKAGLLPPESGHFNNPYCEWIGAQMRGAILGQLYPANPRMAAQAAWMDGEISHATNGILGEVFNAIMTSLAFSQNDLSKTVEMAIDMMPADSEYGKCVRFALAQCKKHSDWLSAWKPCEKEYERYNWVHAYPNACAEVIALWFCEKDFTKLLSICGGCGQDVDCNAAQVATVFSTMYGLDSIPEYWKESIGDRLDTYVRGLKVLSIHHLAERTAEVARRLDD